MLFTCSMSHIDLPKIGAIYLSIIYNITSNTLYKVGGNNLAIKEFFSLVGSEVTALYTS